MGKTVATTEFENLVDELILKTILAETGQRFDPQEKVNRENARQAVLDAFEKIRQFAIRDTRSDPL
jgi:hypothetical protein